MNSTSVSWRIWTVQGWQCFSHLSYQKKNIFSSWLWLMGEIYLLFFSSCPAVISQQGILCTYYLIKSQRSRLMALSSVFARQMCDSNKYIASHFSLSLFIYLYFLIYNPTPTVLCGWAGEPRCHCCSEYLGKMQVRRKSYICATSFHCFRDITIPRTSGFWITSCCSVHCLLQLLC